MQKITPRSILRNGYFLSGIDGNAGKLHVPYFISGIGTCLCPVWDENGNNIICPEYAGKEVKETNFKA